MAATPMLITAAAIDSSSLPNVLGAVDPTTLAASSPKGPLPSPGCPANLEAG
jgi:hypothetical protein